VTISNVELAARSFEVFSPLLKVRTPSSEILPLYLNPIQRAINESIIDQHQRIGMVRKLVLKSRRQGVSSYAMARMYWRTLFRRGIGAFCLTHHQETTDQLFAMIERFRLYLPQELQFATSDDSAKGFTFTKTQSSMNVGTAGSKLVGHGFTITDFMGSEVSRWPNAADHFEGIMQAISMVQGTEIILESVGGARGSLFHNLCIDALKGKGAFEFLFFPWFQSPEFSLEDTSEWERSPVDMEFQREYRLNDNQMAWRAAKLREFSAGGDPEVRFAAMYPATPDDAFMRIEGGFIDLISVRHARKQTYVPLGPLVFGVDVGGGKDRTALIRRRGKVAYGVETTMEPDPMLIAAWVARRMEADRPQVVFMDASGASVGAAVVSRLRELGFNVVGVQFGGKADDGDAYLNKRVEMWALMRDWLGDGAEIPDREDLEADLMAPSKLDDDVKGRVRLESKIDMRARGVPSPDIADALALTFAYPVKEDRPPEMAKTLEQQIHTRRATKTRTRFGIEM
jgi:hypothetical protein